MNDLVLLLFFNVVLGSIFGIFSRKRNKCFLDPLTWYIILTVVSVLSAVASVMLAKKPQKPDPPNPAGIEDFTTPTIDQTRKIQCVFGTVRQKDPNLVWYGDLKNQGIYK